MTNHTQSFVDVTLITISGLKEMFPTWILILSAGTNLQPHTRVLTVCDKNSIDYKKKIQIFFPKFSSGFFRVATESYINIF